MNVMEEILFEAWLRNCHEYSDVTFLSGGRYKAVAPLKWGH